jgi:hypothetical protein
MSQPSPDPPRALPRWVVVAGSVVIAAHLLAVGAHVLAAPSGPWFVPQLGPLPADPPQFALAVDEVAVPNYLEPAKLLAHYHFSSNRLSQQPGARFTVRLTDSSGKHLKTLEFPDKEANPWVRHRQELLAKALANDDVQPLPEGVRLSGQPGGRKVEYWLPETETRWTLQVVEEHKLHKIVKDLRDQKKLPPMMDLVRPSDWAMLVARSYARHLCREHGAARAEVIRTTQMPPRPELLRFQGRPEDPPPPLGYPHVITANFGELTP